jgi:FdrA protein
MPAAARAGRRQLLSVPRPGPPGYRQKAPAGAPEASEGQQQMSVEHVEARAGAYADSITLMLASTDVQAAPGVEAALIAMATDLNLALLAGLGFTAPAGAGRGDLLIAVRASDDAALAAALATVAAALAARPAAAATAPGEQPPRTVGAAARRAGPGLALVSVPGPYAFAEALDALEAGCDVMIFSDNVPVAQEVLLKDLAAERDLLVMGPDCGTAVVAGVGLGFSHAAAAGPVGLVAASGTGAQQVVCLLDAAGVGVSAVLGTGGRDLSAAVGGRSARAALAALDADPATRLILVIGKPPAPEVAAALRGCAESLGTPVRFAFTGPGEPDLAAAAGGVLRALGRPVPDWPRWPGPPARPRPGALRGLFAGGTLCYEAMSIASERLGVIGSNIPLHPDWRVDPLAPPATRPPAARPPATGARAPAAAPAPAQHIMIDFGDDALTAGRPHPMIDQTLRLARLAAEAADPAVAVLLLDVVLGYGAHPDPAAELAPAIAAARAGRDLPVVVSLIGARSDPQGLAGQAAALQAAGAHVFAANAAAARFACGLVTP